MNSTKSWEAEYNHEIMHARLARLEGNQGKARVCARRAAGIVIGEYLHLRGYTQVSNSYFDRISLFLELPNIDEKAREISRHFLLKVNQVHQLPVKVDLLNDAAWLREFLMKDE